MKSRQCLWRLENSTLYDDDVMLLCNSTTENSVEKATSLAAVSFTFLLTQFTLSYKFICFFFSAVLFFNFLFTSLFIALWIQFNSHFRIVQQLKRISITRPAILVEAGISIIPDLSTWLVYISSTLERMKGKVWILMLS